MSANLNDNNSKLDNLEKAIRAAKHITRNYLARVSNTRFEVINKWYNNDVEKMDLDILARICYVLEFIVLPS